jgi:hypothetical protein
MRWSILPRTTEEKTERANCHFVIKQTLDGKPQIIVERYHQSISALNNTVLGFDLLGGTTLEQAKKAVALSVPKKHCESLLGVAQLPH